MIFFNDLNNSDLRKRVIDIVDKIIANGEITLSTSGTTGKPKIINQDTSSLNKKIGSKDERWVLCYSPDRWAGISVVSYCTKTDCSLFIPASFSAKDIVDCCIASDITHISCTPSMFKSMLLSSVGFTKTNFKQITFGGEYCTQPFLDSVMDLFPNTRITHVYASTECGDICSASDGLEGYPENKFSRFRLKETGEIVINGIETGDIWKLDQDKKRYVFEGRISEIINVGGNKVSPILIESECMKIGATFARAYATPNPILGQLVALDYIGDIEINVLKNHFIKNFPKYAIPVRINKIDSMDLTEAGKTRRA